MEKHTPVGKMEVMKVDIRKLQEQIESVLEGHKNNAYSASIEAEESTKSYKISSPKAQLKIVIGNKWVGYDLTIVHSS
jgi:hypothetical protein